MENNKEVSQKTDLILRYLQGQLNSTEEAELEGWMAEDAGNRRFVEMLKQEEELKRELTFFSALDTDLAWQKIAMQTRNQPKQISLWRSLEPWKYAAVVLFMLASAFAIFQVLNRERVKPSVAIKKLPHLPDVPPGEDKAKLTLADGKVIFLQDIKDGIVREVDGIKIIKQNGQITYQIAQNDPNNQKISFNQITTPKGGQFRIVLPDGSKVWLNSASSLYFPTAFSSSERRVELTGEGYFEIAENKALPFKVQANGTIVEVLGTHFNIMAYNNENSINTTLLEGSVKVSNGTETKVMVPGQQARISRGIELIAIDVEEVVAWKNGLFQFNNADLSTIMRQLERWYNVDFVYAGQLPEKHFTGIISRKTNISQVAKMLELSGGIQFKIEGRKITIISKQE